jgi:hypothetical protein
MVAAQAGLANFAAADLDGLVRIVKRKLKKIEYRPHLIGGCLGVTGRKSNPGDHVHYEFNLVKQLPDHQEERQHQPSTEKGVATTGASRLSRSIHYHWPIAAPPNFC